MTGSADAAKDHAGLVDKVLRSGTIITLEVDTVSPTPRSFTIERVVHEPPVVKDGSGTVINLRPSDVAGHVEVFGQHELAELAGDAVRVAEMLQRFDGSGGIDAEHQGVLELLAHNRDQIRKAEAARSALNDELGDIPRLEEQVQQFKETDLESRLADQKRLDRDESVFTEADRRLGAAVQAIEDLVDPQLEATLTAAYDGLEESPRKEQLEVVATATRTSAATLKQLASDATAALATARDEIASAKTAWDAAVKGQRDGHAEVLRKLHEDGFEPDKYLATTKTLDELNAKQPRLASHDEALRALSEERHQLLGRLADHERAQVEELHEAVRSANAATQGVVVVRPIAAPDRQHILDVIQQHISGQRSQITAAAKAEGFSPRALAAAIRAGVDQLAALDIKGAQAANLVSAGEPLARELEELTVGYAVEVLLDVGPQGQRDLKTMNALSKGQRATALLLLLLGASTAPLVIDQPEDDLDNRFVYDGVVQRLRKLKGIRQVIASSHNANVPVLGDAELIVALEGDGQHGEPADGGIGSLDDEAIRSLAENLLEGGPAAFNARQHLYGF